MQQEGILVVGAIVAVFLFLVLGCSCKGSPEKFCGAMSGGARCGSMGWGAYGTPMTEYAGAVHGQRTIGGCSATSARQTATQQSGPWSDQMYAAYSRPDDTVAHYGNIPSLMMKPWGSAVPPYGACINSYWN